MLPTANNLKSDRDIDLVKDEGKLFQSPSFGVRVYKRLPYENPNGESRFAFIISNKISKLAVHRNRIRRAMKQATRYKLTKMKKGYDFVFFVKPSIGKKLTEEIMKEVDRFFEKEKFVI